MNRITNPTLKHTTSARPFIGCLHHLSSDAAVHGQAAAVAATTLPVLWTAGGLSAGNDSAGNAARIAADASGNVAVVSGPSGGRDLAVTSYTATGSFRWRSTVSPVVRERSSATGWSLRPTAISSRSVTTRTLTAVRSPAPWSGTPPTGRYFGGWTSPRDSSLPWGGLWLTLGATNTSPGARPEAAF